MKRLVIDASVAVKWLLSEARRDSRNEKHIDHALAMLNAFQEGRVELVQPPHWLAEVGAVLARLEPGIAGKAIQLLDAMEIPIHIESEIFTRAIELTKGLDHHLFDTLYHAVALAGPADTLVTADMRYFRKAKHLGAICPLSEFIHT